MKAITVKLVGKRVGSKLSWLARRERVCAGTEFKNQNFPNKHRSVDEVDGSEARRDEYRPHVGGHDREAVVPEAKPLSASSITKSKRN